MTKQVIGWREWVGLPELGLDRVKAKVDTGARTSALHTFASEAFVRDGEKWVKFGLHPVQDSDTLEHWCEARVIDRREVTDSGGHRELRFVIRTPVTLGDATWPIEVTLASRDSMRFRMLLGRTAMRGRVTVDPGKSFQASDPGDDADDEATEEA